MTYKQIAKALNITQTQARAAFKKGMRKIWAMNEVNIILHTLHAATEDTLPELEAESLECRQDWIMLYSHTEKTK